MSALGPRERTGGSAGLLVVPAYTTITLPTTATLGTLVIVTDDPGGAVLAYWNGANWLRATDKSVIV